MSNRPAPMGKRILAALIDYFIIFYLVGFLYNLFYKIPAFGEPIDLYNNLYNSIALEQGYGVLDSSSNISYVTSNTSLTSAFKEALEANSSYETLLSSARTASLLNNIISITIVELLYLLLIPMLSKKGQTLGKMLLGLGVVDIRYDMFLSNKNKLIRFAMGFGVETILILILSHFTGMFTVDMFAPMLVLMTIMISQNRQALHDVVSHAKVIDLKTATIFSSVEEKIEFDASLKEKQENNQEDTYENNDEIINEENNLLEGEVIEKTSEENITEVINEETSLDNKIEEENKEEN